jgi:preprotein translocase subunit Sec61beta
MQTRSLWLLAAGFAALLPAAPAAAQTVREGMTEAQVRGALGDPAQVRRTGDGWTYLFYQNGCAVRCGSDDVVFLREGRVATAVFRTPRRRFAGPAPATALEGAAGAPAPSAPRATGGARPAAEAAPGQAQVTGIRVTIPGSEEVTLGGAPAAPGARSGIIVYGDEGAQQGTAVDPRGVIIIRDAVGTDTILSDEAMDRARQERERNVVPRTIRPDGRDAPVADSTMTPRIRERERSVTPRTIRPQTPGTPR